MKMRNIAALAAAVGLSFMMTTGALAQKPGGQKGQKRERPGRGIQLAAIPVAALDSLVKLTPEQKTKLTAIHDKFQADVKALPKDPSSREKRRDLSRGANQEILAVLTDEQKAKLKDIAKDFGPLIGAGIPLPLLQELKLTDDQKKKIADIVVEARKSAASGPVDRKAMREQIQSKVAAILTPEQKTIVTKYMAENTKGKKKKKA